MKHLAISLSLVAATSAIAFSQDGEEERLVPVPLSTVECEEVTEVPSGHFDADLWAARLVEGDLDLRMAAYEAIVEAGGRDDSVFRSIQAWAADPAVGELAWTARMALRELEKRPVKSQDPWGFGAGDLDWFRTSPLGGLGMSPDEIERNLQNKFDQLQRQMQQGFAPGAIPGSGFEQRSFSVEFGPNGMKVRTRRSGAGGDNEHQWEAQNIDELLKAHPELESEFPGLGGLRLRFGAPAGSNGALVPPAEGDPRTDVLGVECSKLDPSEVEHLGLPGDLRGLLVIRTVPGSIADELGVRRGDILTSLNKGPLRKPADITKALTQRGPDEPVRLGLINAGGQDRTIVWSPRGPGDAP